MALALFNTRNKKKETFQPHDNNHVRMYVCGPTVYSAPHIGNARPAVAFDVLYRLLQATYPKVTYVRNITDVDDKINRAALAQKKSISEITAKFIKIYHDDMKHLNCLAMEHEPRATEHIPDMIQMIEILIARGFAYEAEKHVLFNVQAYPEYGQLSHRSEKEQLAGARVEVAPYKKNPADFVLWKPSTNDLPGWDSPWGRGRPGWHIECSAMIHHYVGHRLDIHAGGADLTFPHHENELAQSECAFPDHPFCKYWLHNGFITVEREKMSKSIGNILLVQDLCQKFHPEVIRFTLLNTHYRQPLHWQEKNCLMARNILNKWYRILFQLPKTPVSPKRYVPVYEALCDDLNTPQAFAAMHQLMKEAEKCQNEAQALQYKSWVLSAAQLLGILQHNEADWHGKNADDICLDTTHIESLIETRNQARQAKDFEKADAIRNQLAAMGIILEDKGNQVTWRYE